MFPLLRQARLKKRLRRAGLRLAALAIGCQLLVPAGYMPGSLANGTPFVLCTMYTPAPAQPAAMAHAAAGHMDAMHAEAPDESADSQHQEHLGAEAWEHCPLGALSAAAALAVTIAPVIAPAGPNPVSTTLTIRPRSVAVITARARAPPQPALNPFS